jgi:hypothetical protein
MIHQFKTQFLGNPALQFFNILVAELEICGSMAAARR